LHEFGSARFPSGFSGLPSAYGERETKSGQITKLTPAVRSPLVLGERDAGGTGADDQADCGECPRNAEDRRIDLGELARHGSGERILEANHRSFRHRVPPSPFQMNTHPPISNEISATMSAALTRLTPGSESCAR